MNNLEELQLAATSRITKLVSRLQKRDRITFLYDILVQLDTFNRAAQKLARRDIKTKHTNFRLVKSRDLINTGYANLISVDIAKNIAIAYFDLNDRHLDPTTVQARLLNNLVAGITASVTRVYSQEILDQYSSVSDRVGKRWVSQLASNTCNYCRLIHGQVVNVHESFTAPEGMKVFYDLLMPPSHPRCRCKIEIITL